MKRASHSVHNHFSVQMSQVDKCDFKRRDHKEASEDPYLGIIPTSIWLGRIILVECPSDESVKQT